MTNAGSRAGVHHDIVEQTAGARPTVASADYATVTPMARRAVK
jgi:hypothetical protein